MKFLKLTTAHHDWQFISTNASASYFRIRWPIEFLLKQSQAQGSFSFPSEIYIAKGLSNLVDQWIDSKPMRDI
jgi:hypothetical protein